MPAPRILGLLATAAALLSPIGASAGPTLDAVKAKDVLRCGVHTGLTGFSAPDSKGQWTGIDVDFCRAMATAILGSPDKVNYTPTNTQNRFTLLQSGEVDILSRNTTWTVSRDTTLGAVFLGTWFYDGQGFMVNRKLGVKNATELDGATVCVLPGTTTELNLTDWFRSKKLQFKPVVVAELSQLTQAFFSGRCDVFTTDMSGLASTRLSSPNKDDYVILPEAISKEPLGPLVRRGDWEFFMIGRWVLNGLIEAEEYGISSENVEKMKAESKDPSIQRILGTSGDLGKGLGLDNDWLVRTIKAVGNYGEIYKRNIGPLGIERGLNGQWRDGGLMYAPPIR